MNRRSLLAGLGLLFLSAGLWMAGEGAVIHAKAWLAQVLIERAWADIRAGEREVRPWPWADTHPVAELHVRRLGVRLVVLDGVSGRTLAFGPGRHHGGAEIGGPGTTVISGHRDTHFRFLRQLRPGDDIVLVDSGGAATPYAVTRAYVAHADDMVDLEAGPRLLLVTCWPFDALVAGGAERFVVEAAATGNPAPERAYSAPWPTLTFSSSRRNARPRASARSSISSPTITPRATSRRPSPS